MSTLNRLQTQYDASESTVPHQPLASEIEWLQGRLDEVNSRVASLDTVIETLTADLAPMSAASDKRRVAIDQAEKRTAKEIIDLRTKAMQAKVKALAVIEAKEAAGELTEEMRDQLIELQKVQEEAEKKADEIREGFIAEINAKYPLNEEVYSILHTKKADAQRERNQLHVKQRYLQGQLNDLQNPREGALNAEELEAYFNAVDSLNALLAARPGNDDVAVNLLSVINFPAWLLSEY